MFFLVWWIIFCNLSRSIDDLRNDPHHLASHWQVIRWSTVVSSDLVCGHSYFHVRHAANPGTVTFRKFDVEQGRITTKKPVIHPFLWAMASTWLPHRHGESNGMIMDTLNQWDDIIREFTLSTRVYYSSSSTKGFLYPWPLGCNLDINPRKRGHFSMSQVSGNLI